MRLAERIRVIRDTREAYETNFRAGMSPDDAQAETLESMREKYGASGDWGVLAELILTLLAVFAK